MESAGGSSVLRNRRLESCFNASSLSNVGESSKVKRREAGIPKQKTDVFVDDNSWIAIVISCIKIVICFVTMMFTTFVWALIMLVLLPWPYARIRQGNVYGHVTGRLLIVWYPLFGQLYVLANHLRIDRSNPSSAIESMKQAARAIVENNLSLIIFPEGTRSKNGRLLPFKKVFVHMALQSRLPIVPMVLTGTHLAWRKNSLHVKPAPLTVKFLPPIRTEDWITDKIDDYIKMVHDIYVKHLPEAQRPLVSEEEDSVRDQTGN
ncbi:1-acyl-sn-glycerol-3-phosphate acyltransferase-like isoform X2 [Telopea speciosissima]|uniref:1-acyl-sn-glycerol-3-phosphate acyltransferase-like isoform X2 n=1 Tax=Telopea speciosissima TaxID=54955 RepID=UPI001CC4A12D|nr:1-acyl-sn-glycerol-3-phosphate acyltransferase-like isoform X2 [Telopea speciosissima]